MFCFLALRPLRSRFNWGAAARVQCFQYLPPIDCAHSALCPFLFPRRQVTAEEYATAEPDPIAPFSAPVAGHMNEDHSDSTIAMIKHYVGITGEWDVPTRQVGSVPGQVVGSVLPAAVGHASSVGGQSLCLAF